MRSYGQAGFFASALVVSKMDGSPGEGFYALLKLLGVIPGTQGEDGLASGQTMFERPTLGLLFTSGFVPERREADEQRIKWSVLP
jgi:hypothetical protein